jgi:hypothetical protein
MRGDYYIWSDGDSLHINDESLPQDIADDYVVMRFAQLVQRRELQAVIERSVERWMGNFGGAALYELQDHLLTLIPRTD